jgi:hypothetical protein
MPEYDVDRLGELHPLIRADDWRSPLVYRLLRTRAYSDGQQAVNSDFLRTPETEACPVLLRWKGLADDYRRCLNTYQEPDLTEFAALGVACVLVRSFADLEITEVTMRGERADYWLGDKQYLLEVSGTESGSLTRLRDQKADQLMANPFNKDGYVCVAVFEERVASLHFYEVRP